jgi:hypothetical protein
MHSQLATECRALGQRLRALREHRSDVDSEIEAVRRSYDEKRERLLAIMDEGALVVTQGAERLLAIMDEGASVVTQVATEGGAPLIAEPVAGDFEYKVRLNVAIPLAWAQVLKATGAHHYDYWCREMSERGVVNGLHNIALSNEDLAFKASSSSWPCTFPVAWRDCDGMMKIMEQAHQEFDLVVIGDIRAWLRRTMDQIEARHREIASFGGEFLDAVPAAGGEGG